MSIEGVKVCDEVFSCPNFASLPDEVMLNIFKFIPKKSLIKLSTTSKRFYRLIFGPDLYRKDVATALFVFSEILGKSIEPDHNRNLYYLLRTMKLMKEHLLNNYSLKMISELRTNLPVSAKKSTLFMYLWEKNILDVACNHIIKSMKVSRAFILKGDLTNYHFELTLNALRAAEIKNLCISSPLPEEQLQRMKYMLQNNEIPVKHIGIYREDLIYSEELKAVFEALETNQNIKSISISRCIFGEDELAILHNSLKLNNSLETLSLSGFVTTETGLCLLAQICNHPSLKQLALQQYVDSELLVFCQNLDRVTLCSLSLKKGFISIETANLLVDMLGRNPGIETLDLMFNQITDEAQEILMKNDRVKFLRKYNYSLTR